MKMDGSFVFDGSREEAWKILQDPEVLKAALPNTKKMELIRPDEYATEMQVRIGPLTGNFTGNVSITDKVEPEHYTMNVEAKGLVGFGKGTVTIKLEEQDDGHTLMQYNGDIQVGGKLASIGQRLLDTVSKSLSKKALESLNEAVKARSAVRD